MHAIREKCHHNSCLYRVTISDCKTPFFNSSRYIVRRKWQICRKLKRTGILMKIYTLFKQKICWHLISLDYQLSNFFDPFSNGSGSKEATTIKHNRGRAETSGPGQEHVPMPPTMNDKYVDLMALILGHRSESSPINYEKVIIKSDSDDSNPSLADLMELKLRWVW